MRALYVAGLLALAAPACAAAKDDPRVTLERQVRDDYNAVRRARYAQRKTHEGTPERDAADKQVKDAKQKLKDDRLKLRELKRRESRTEATE